MTTLFFNVTFFQFSFQMFPFMALRLSELVAVIFYSFFYFSCSSQTLLLSNFQTTESYLSLTFVLTLLWWNFWPLPVGIFQMISCFLWLSSWLHPPGFSFAMMSWVGLLARVVPGPLQSWFQCSVDTLWLLHVCFSLKLRYTKLIKIRTFARPLNITAGISKTEVYQKTKIYLSISYMYIYSFKYATNFFLKTTQGTLILQWVNYSYT